MLRYIDAEKFLEDNKEFADREFIHPRIQTTLRYLVDEAPTADVEPVIHGHWRLEEETFSCSNCNAIFFCGFNTKRENEIRLKECYKFCPVCGAKMDEEDNNVQTENR